MACVSLIHTTHKRKMEPMMIKTTSFKRRAFWAMTALALSLSASLPAMAEDKVSLKFEVAVSGIKALVLSYSANIGEKAYQAETGINVKGIASLFTDFDFAAKAEGRVLNGRLIPGKFDYQTADEDKKKQLNVSYAANGNITTKRNYQLKPGQEADVERVLKPGTPDPLTVFITMSAQPSANICSGKWRSYNGAELVDYQFTRLGTGNYKGKVDYQGPVIHCRLELKPVAGVSDKRLKKWSKNPPIYDLWFAPVSTSSGRPMHLLIAAEGQAGKTSFTAWASTAEISGRKLASR